MTNYRLLTIINALFYTAVGITSPLLTLYLESLGASYAQISLMLTSFVAVILLGSYAWGRMSDWMGRRKPLLIGGLLGVALASYLLSWAPGVAWAWAARLIGSLFTATFTTLSLALMGDVLEVRDRGSRARTGGRGRSMGLYRGVGSLAFAVGALTGGRLADAYSLRFIFVVCAGLYAAAAFCTVALREVVEAKAPTPQNAAPTTGSATPPTSEPAHHLPYLFLAGVMLWMMAHSASASMWPNFMSQLGYTNTAIGSLWGLAAFIEMPAMFAAGALSDLTGRTLMLAAGGFGIALTNLGYLTLAQYFPALLGIQVLRGFGFGSYTTSAMTYTAEFGGQRTRGRTSGLFNTVGSAGQLVGSLAGGMLAQTQGFQFMFGFCAISALFSGFCFLALRWQTNDAHGGAWRTIAEP